MTPIQQQAFYDGAGFSAHYLSAELRLAAGLLLTVIAVFLVAGLMKLLDHGAEGHFRILFYLISLSIIVMIFFTFIA